MDDTDAKALSSWDRKSLEMQVIQYRSRGRSVKETCDELGISTRTYHQLILSASRRASKHLSDQASVYLLNVLCRLDRATEVMTEAVIGGDLRAANALANLANSTANLMKNLQPDKKPKGEEGSVSPEILEAARRMGVTIPRPLLPDKTSGDSN